MDWGSFNRPGRAPHTPNPYLPIVVVTAYTELQHVTRARDCGVNEYLAKPVSAKSIYARICSLVDNVRPFIRCAGFFGPDRRRRRIEHGNHERRAHANTKSANRRMKDVITGLRERRQGRPGYKAPERRERNRLGVERQTLVMKGINDLIPT